MGLVWGGESLLDVLLTYSIQSVVIVVIVVIGSVVSDRKCEQQQRNDKVIEAYIRHICGIDTNEHDETKEHSN